MDTTEKKVGIFAIRQLEPGRWQVTNTLTTYVHKTYGSEEEVTQQLKVQTGAWQAKFQQINKNKGKAGAAWRNKNQAQLAQIRAAQETETPS
jgi:hypothetical protein